MSPLISIVSDSYRINQAEFEWTMYLEDRIIVLAQLGYSREVLKVVRVIEEEYQGERVMAKLVSHLVKLSQGHIYLLWMENLVFRRKYSSKDLLLEISALKLIIVALGGMDAVMETTRSIQAFGH